MIDILGRDIHIGDKVVYVGRTSKNYHSKSYLRYGIVTKISKTSAACYCKTLNKIPYYDNEEILVYSKQIFKI